MFHGRHVSFYCRMYYQILTEKKLGTNLTGWDLSPPRLSNSLCGTGYQRKFNFQLNPPHVMSDPVMYSNVSSLITSMIGHATDVLKYKQNKYQYILNWDWEFHSFYRPAAEWVNISIMNSSFFTKLLISRAGGGFNNFRALIMNW